MNTFTHPFKMWQFSLVMLSEDGERNYWLEWRCIRWCWLYL